MVTSAKQLHDESQTTLAERYRRVRDTTTTLVRPLSAEDTVVQSMPDVSPSKWHLAHSTWFFERFLLREHARNYQEFDASFDYLFNSYYHTVGQMHQRPERGLLSRPGLAEVLDYRSHVDDAMLELIRVKKGDNEIASLVVLGLNHEQQHQELLLTDIKHVFSVNPTMPAVYPDLPLPPAVEARPMQFTENLSGIRQIGAETGKFCFDNEMPKHPILVLPHAIGDRLVTNAEYREFIHDGGYEQPELWLSDGWAKINESGWRRPLYWTEELDAEFTLGGLRRLDVNAPVAHVSYYEADAYARWAGARLPTEFEWEVNAAREPLQGNLYEQGYLQPAGSMSGQQFFGDTWEWTSSAYSPYPGFKPLNGSLGEYNGKFMCSQVTVRGGSCVTPADHIRASYRSFFYPDARWQFLGIRLARDVDA